MSNFLAGHAAEKRAVKWLQNRGFAIRALNWRTRYCEIDIVAESAGVIYFVEVKYRRSERFGSGFEYITPHKLRRMHFAARLWIQHHNWPGPCQLAVVSAVNNRFCIALISF